MTKLISSMFLGALLMMPTVASALTITPQRASSSSSPARAGSVSSTSAGTTVTPPTDPQEAGTDYLLELGGVEGESTEGKAIEPDEIDVMMKSNSSQAPKKGNVEIQWKVEEGESAPGVEPDEIDVNIDTEKKKGKVDYDWKVEEGESAPGVEPDEIGVAVDPEPLTPDFGILLGGGGDTDNDDDDELVEESRAEVAEILLQGMLEQGAPAETLSLNYEKIKTKATQPVKLFGFIPMNISATVEVDADASVEVDYPWWGFLASGKDGEALGQQIVSSLSNVLKTKHDTVMNAIGNVK